MTRTIRRLLMVLMGLAIGGVWTASALLAEGGPTLTSQNPGVNASVNTLTEITATYNEELDPSSTIVLKNSAGNVVANNTPTFRQSSVANDTIVLTVDETTLLDSASPFTVEVVAKKKPLSALTTQTSWNFTLDRVAPNAPSIVSVAGDNSSPATGGDSSPSVVVQAAPGDIVELVVDGTDSNVTKTVAAGTTSVTFNSSSAEVTLPTTSGTYALTAKSTDAAQNASPLSAPFSYALDVTAPAIPSITSVQGVTSAPTTDNDTSPTIVVSGVVAGDTVKLFDNGSGTATSTKAVPIGQTSVTFNGSTPDDFSGLSEGNHSFTATATDPFGNASNPSTAFLYNVDLTAPNPSISSVHGDTTTPGAGNDTSPTIVVGGTIAADDVVQVFDGATALTPTTTVATGQNTVTFNLAATVDFTISGEGNHSLTVKATDPSGNVSNASSAFDYYLDNGTVPPELVSTSPVDQSISATVTSVTATFNEPLDTTSSTLVVRDATGSTVIVSASTFSSENKTITVTHSGLSSAGSPYTATATVEDVNGNQTVRAWAFFVNTPRIDSIIGDTSSPALGNDPTPSVVVSNLSNNDSVQLYDNGVAVGTAQSAPPTGTATVTFTDVPLTGGAGTHSLTAKKTTTPPGGSPTTSGHSPTFVYNLDLTAPAAPTVVSVFDASTSPVPGNDTSPTVVISGVTAGDTARIFDGANEMASKVVPTGQTSVTFNPGTTVDFTIAGDNAHTFTATATDPATNVSAASAGFVYNLDTTAPAAPTIASVHAVATSPATGADTSPAVVVNGLVAGDTARIFDGANEMASKVVPTGQTSVTFNGGATEDFSITGDGTHAFTAKSSDPLANLSAASTAFSYNLDATPPAAPTITSVHGVTTSPTTGVDTSPTVVVSGLVAGDTARIFDGATQKATKTVPTGQTSVTFNSGATEDFSITGDGAHAFTAKSSDPLVNLSAASAAFTYNLDTTGPGAPVIASISGDSSSPVADNDTSPTVVVNGVAAGDTVRIVDGATQKATKTVPTGQTSVTFNSGATEDFTITGDGPHAFTAVATDPLGNASATSSVFTYNLDTAAPPAPAITSIEGSTSSPAKGSKASPAVVVGGVAAGDVLTLREAATVLATATVPDGATSVTFNGDPKSPQFTLTGTGAHSLNAFTTDAVGNVGPSSSSFTYDLAVSHAEAAQGYSLVGEDGSLYTFGSAKNLGDMSGKKLNGPIIGAAYTPGGAGYWLVGSDGGIFTFGDATFFGSMGGKPLNSPIIGMAATPTGKGYWLFASDGGIFTFGDATFFGSMGGKPLNAPIINMEPVASGKGYWLVGSDGGIFTFGDAKFFGSMGGKPLNQPVFDITSSDTDGGYWLIARDGGIFSFGDAAAKFYGSAVGASPAPTKIIGMDTTPDGLGYWIADANGKVYIFGSATYLGDRHLAANPAPMTSFAAVPPPPE